MPAPTLKNEVTSLISEGSVRKFLHDHTDPGVFAPDAVSTLIAAFDGAWQSIIASGARLSGHQSELTRELLAKYIIEQARQGELDECRAQWRPASLGSVKSETVPPEIIPQSPQSVRATTHRLAASRRVLV